MNILFASYEAVPFFKKGGLGDVAGALPLALAKAGIKITLILPKYKCLYLPHKTYNVGHFQMGFVKKNETIQIMKMNIKKGVCLYLVHHPYLNEVKEDEYKEFHFLFFSKAIAAMLLQNSSIFGKFDLVHLNDWHTASVPVFLSTLTIDKKTIPTILTIHNLLYQGVINKEQFTKYFGLQSSSVSDDINILKLGIKNVDFVTTVSPNYAKELTSNAKGMNLQDVLYQKRNKFTGILNGIDYDVWNPETDQFIPMRFNKNNVNKSKIENKESIQRELKLTVSANTPLVSFVGRLEPHQKGIDLICEMLGDTLSAKGSAKGFQFILLGKGHNVWVKRIGSYVFKYPKRVSFINKFDEVLAHKVYAASDIILIPSKFEPCGLVQMIAMRYGTLPLVRKTGGLADTVKDLSNGFVFESYSPTALARTLRLALKLFHDNPDKIAKMRSNAMQEDFSWDKSARQYKKLYQKVIKEKLKPCNSRCSPGD